MLSKKKTTSELSKTLRRALLPVILVVLTLTSSQHVTMFDKVLATDSLGPVNWRQLGEFLHIQHYSTHGGKPKDKFLIFLRRATQFVSNLVYEHLTFHPNPVLPRS